MAEDVLVGHLDAVGTLCSDSTHCLLNVHSPSVYQTSSVDVHRDKRTYIKSSNVLNMADGTLITVVNQVLMSR